MDYIKDQTVNSFNASIIDELKTPEQRQAVAEKVVNTLFNPTSTVEFYGLKEFEHKSSSKETLPPSIYWTYVFTIPASAGYQTITIDNHGGMDFSFHHINIRSFNYYFSVK